MPKPKTKKTRVREEQERLNGFFVDVYEIQRETIAPLIQNAAFMKVLLEDMQEVINENGATEIYHNGENQYGRKPSAAMQAYNATIKNYASVMKSLSLLLPKGPLNGERLEAFLSELTDSQ